jgi:hypothetical protein
MSTRNTKVSNAAFGEWRVDPDHRQDRGSGPVETYHLSPEEIEARYGHIKSTGNSKPIVPGDLKEYWNRKEQEKEGEEEEDMSMAVQVIKVSKAEVIRLHGEGKTLEELIEYFSPVWHGKQGLLKAKILLYLSGKPSGGHRKKSIVPPGAEVINNAEASDRMEPEVYPDLNEVAADLDKQVDEAIKNLPDPTLEPENETVNHPLHYTTGKIEVIDYLQDKLPAEMFEGFCVGNSLKYLSRYRYKGGLDDLKKARWYLDRIIKIKEVS